MSIIGQAPMVGTFVGITPGSSTLQNNTFHTCQVSSVVGWFREREKKMSRTRQTSMSIKQWAFRLRSCDCKTRYRSVKDVKDVADRMRRHCKETSYYWCRFCKGFHLTRRKRR